MVLSTFARLWYARMLLAAPSTPTPRDGSVVRAGDGAGDRVLVLGNGPLHGWGVTRRELSAPGHLAFSLHARTGRPTTVEYVGDERMNAASALAWLGRSSIGGHDVIVIGIGMNDALRLVRVQRWREDVQHLLQRILEDADDAVRVLVVGLPHIRRYVMADSWMGGVAARRAERMTEVLQHLAQDHGRVEFVPAPMEQFETDRPIGSSPMYRAWAESLVDHIVPRLDEVRAIRPPTPEPHARWEWSGTPAALARPGRSGGADRLEAVAESVRARFGVAMAAVNVLDGDRAYFVAGGAGAPTTMPRSLAYCDVAVAADEPLVVLDSALDPRFRDNPFLDLAGLSFYAGVPLHANDGRAVATLCILDPSPRRSFDVADLQQYAAAAETELRALEPDLARSRDRTAGERQV